MLAPGLTIPLTYQKIAQNRRLRNYKSENKSDSLLEALMLHFSNTYHKIFQKTLPVFKHCNLVTVAFKLKSFGNT